MINKIKSINNFGVFNEYNWNSVKELQPFKEKNIIYGWNYSGKTTISKIFSSLKIKKIHEKFKGGEFKIVYNDNKELGSENLKNFEIDVQVFNAEFIKENLKWDTNESLDAISFDVGENVSIRNQIDLNIELINKIDGTDTLIGKKNKFNEIISDFNTLEDKKFTDEARIIKIEVFNSLIEFNKMHLKTIKSEIKNNLEIHIIEDSKKIEEIKKAATANNDKIKIEPIDYSEKVHNIYVEIKKILSSQPDNKKIIEILDTNNKLYNWTKLGLDLHKENNNETCSFCGNNISEDRYNLLTEYFSNESSELYEIIEKYKSLINEECKLIDKINRPSSKNDFIENCQLEFINKIDDWESIKIEYKSFLKKLENELSRKLNGNIFNNLDIITYDTKPEEDLVSWVEDVNLIIKKHNDFVTNFNSEQAKARDILKKHLVADFLIRENFINKVKEKKYAESCIKKYDKLVKKIKIVNEGLFGKLKDIVAGKNELNKFIKAFIGREDINIEVSHDDRFILKRGEKIAENLSEGEKTAISFAYFLVKLESLHRDKKLKDAIIFIDDPISSLDSNHIAQVYSLINSFFFRKGEDPSNLEASINCFKQLFISTHNFDFFSFLKDSHQLNKKNKSNIQSGCEFYLIQRLSNNNSKIVPLPKSLKNKSEYIYLFKMIYEFYKNGCDLSDENLILLPNSLRRFLEIYTLMKLPGFIGEIDNRLNYLAGTPNNLKILHHFSHFTNFDKISKHDELIMLLPKATEELISLLELDKTHFESLKQGII